MLPGQPGIRGKQAVVDACTRTLSDLAGTTTTFDRLLVVAEEHVAAVDAIGRYVDADGAVSVVSSADLYEFDGGLLTRITSYAVELDAG